MATTAHQPLLGHSPKKSNSDCKTISIVLSIIAIATPLAFVSLPFITTNHSDHLNICDQSHDPASCLTLLTDVVGDIKSSNNAHLLHMFLTNSISHITNVIKSTHIVNARTNDLKEQAALADCIELMESSSDRVQSSIEAINTMTDSSRFDAHTWLSSVLSNHVTCLDGLHITTRPMLKPELEDLIARARTSLAMFVAISQPSEDEMFKPLNGKLPSWITMKDRKLLKALPTSVSINAVVAKDGSGNYTTVQQAIDGAPVKSKTRYVIHVKNGIYNENVKIDKKKKNLMLLGDGMDLTIITGSLNNVDVGSTYGSATVAVNSDGFMAQDICFQNTAGPQKYQAVALRTSADTIVINRCKIDAYQDTFYAHSNRQFIRDSTIIGTIDFIFGDAAVVFQNCTLIARKPMARQKNMFTAQGREDPNENTGTSIQMCQLLGTTDLAPDQNPTYLGRPWKEYSRTVVMQSNIGSLVDPAGWHPWNDSNFALSTLYYGEYMNNGPGAGTSKRVTWPGYHVITSPAEAIKFTVDQLIQGGVWLQSTGVTYIEGL